PRARHHRHLPPRSHQTAPSVFSAGQTAFSCRRPPNTAISPAGSAGPHSATWHSPGYRRRHRKAPPGGRNTSSPDTRRFPDSRPFGLRPPAQRQYSVQRRVSLQSQVGSWVHAPFFGFHCRLLRHAPVTGQDAALPVAFAAVARVAFGRTGGFRPPLLAGDLPHHGLQRIVGEISNRFSFSGSSSIGNSLSIFFYSSYVSSSFIDGLCTYQLC